MTSDRASDCFAHPDIPCEEWARFGESVAAWLDRSTVPRAREVRCFVNATIGGCPTRIRGQLCHAVRHRWESGLAEVVTARILTLLGARIEMEPELESGKRPDFLAHFPDGPTIVEVVTPDFGREGLSQRGEDDLLVHLIEKRLPSGWGAIVNRLPPIDASTSKGAFKRVIDEVMGALPDSRGQRESLRIVRDVESGTLEMLLIDTGRNLGVSGPGYGYVSESRRRITDAVERKRKGGQLDGGPFPALLVICARPMFASMNDFDQALLGHTVAVVDRTGREVDQRFDPSGLLSQSSMQKRNVGVLVLRGLSPFGCEAMVLYRPPGSDVPLPAALSVLDQRTLVGDELRAVRHRSEEILSQFRWAVP
jgi:hypothetical protein